LIDTVILEVWTRVLDRARKDIGERTYGMWLERTSFLSLRRGVLSFGVPNLFIRDWVEEHYGEILERLAGEELGTAVRVSVKVDAGLFREMRQKTQRMEDAAGPGPDLSEGKTLESFLPTAGSKEATLAIRRCLDLRAKSILSPVVVYGPIASGKSHLAAGATRLLPVRSRSQRLTGEELARRFAWKVKTKAVDEFREALATLDLLVIDDAQDLSCKLATQREFLGIADELRTRGGRLIIFLSAHPGEVPDLEPSFRSFLLSGYLVRIEPPQATERPKILEAILSGGPRRFPRDVVALLLTHLPEAPLPEVARALRKLYALAGLTGEPVDEDFVTRHLAEVASAPDPAERRAAAVLLAVEERFAVSREDLTSKRKTKALALPRAMAVYLLRESANLTFKEIGRRLGDRSHTSVFLTHRKIEAARESRPEIAAMVTELSGRVSQGSRGCPS
jgi:chromosomal replication initiator protein